MPEELKHVLFARLGYMQYYSGSQKGDEKPVGGGKYNKKNIGHEVYNFKDVRGRLYGYFQPNSPKRSSYGKAMVNLERIDPNANGSAKLDDVLVIFVSASPTEGQVVVGWYNKATVYRHFQRSKQFMGRGDYKYNLECNTKDAVLLPSHYRTCEIPRGKNGMGQANAGYVYYDTKGTPKTESWIRKAIKLVHDYSGMNLLVSPDDEFSYEAEALQETHRAKQTGQGFSITPELRKKIEEYAVNRAVGCFKKLGYDVEYVGNRKSYDLLCKRSNKELRVEVKGSQTTGNSVILTPNEVANAKEHSSALFILHSVKVHRSGKKQYEVSGGQERVLNPWKVSGHGILKAVTYNYVLR